MKSGIQPPKSSIQDPASSIQHPAIRSLRARQAALMRQAVKFGDPDFDPRENLVRLNRPDVPAYSGLAVGHTSLDYAVTLLETGGDADRARKIIHRILDLQIRDRSDPGYGNFPFMAHWKGAPDPNAVCFLTPNLVHVRTRHARTLGPALVKRLDACWPLCAEALQRYAVAWDYSNIQLLSLASKFLLAPLLPGSSLETEARVRWREWLYRTARHGLTEYNSPTYLPVCLYALDRLYTFGPRDLRLQFERTLEYFHFELAARFHAPAGFLTGAMSRAYPLDMEAGKSFAALAAHLQWGTPCAPGACMIANWLLGRYAAPDRLRRIALRKRLPLEIRSDVIPPGLRRTDYLAQHFTLGSQTGASYHPQEVPLFATLRAEEGGSAVFARPTFTRSAHLMSEQHGPEVAGLYFFDPVTTRYFYHGRNIRPEPSLPKTLAFDWHLGQQGIFREARFNGAAWDGTPQTAVGEAVLALSTRHASLGLRVRVLPSDKPGAGVPAVTLAWRERQLVLSVTVCAEAMRHADHACAGSMAFYLCLANGSGARAMERKARQAALEGHQAVLQMRASAPAAWVRVPGRAFSLGAPEAVFLHRSPLARIQPDELLDFFFKEKRAPW